MTTARTTNSSASEEEELGPLDPNQEAANMLELLSRQSADSPPLLNISSKSAQAVLRQF